ncbi:MAG: ATP-binding protein [Deltaproteobacteria bacterium]|nr:ATP-binding protein [Deltaproteobacteria bacterium]
MTTGEFRLGYHDCLRLLRQRLAEPAPGRIQLLSGPRQVGKTTLLLDLAAREGSRAVYAAADDPAAALPGFWERAFARAEEIAAAGGRAVVLLDEAHLAHDWAGRLKGVWDRLRRRKIPIHIVASGSSALHLARGSRESLAGRFESLTLGHWTAGALAEAFGCTPRDAARLAVEKGTYPGAFGMLADRARWSAYVRDSILEPAIGRDLLALQPVRRPALLRQVFAVAASSPAQIVSLQKLQGQLQDAGTLETIAHYLGLLADAYLVAPLMKLSDRQARRRAAPPKLVTLNNALLAVMDPLGGAERAADPKRFGAWVENACLAHAWNAGQRVTYWREEPFEVDGVIEGSWGAWAVEVKTGSFQTGDLRGLFELVRRYPKYKPLVVCDESSLPVAARAEIAAVAWQDFLLAGPPGVGAAR